MNAEIKQQLEKILTERTFSFSRLSLIETCLRQFLFKYILKLTENETLPLNFGKAVHKAIEEYAKGVDDQQALLNGLAEVNYYPIQMNEYVRLFENAKRHIQKGIVHKENVELEYHFTFELGEGIKLQGFVDVLKNIQGVFYFIDWKTNRVMYEVDDTYQLALYALALRTLKNANFIGGELVFLRFYRKNRKQKSFQLVEMEKARKWALTNAKRALGACEDVLNGTSTLEESFPTTVTSKCSFCAFADLCITVEKEGLGVLLNEPIYK